MTKDEIIEMAEQAGDTLDKEWLQRFAKLVAEHERKECADMIEDYENIDWNIYDCAKAIRERGQE